MVVVNEALADPFVPLTPEKLENPYPLYARLRAEAPVWWSDEGGYWLITKYADVNAILHARPLQLIRGHQGGENRFGTIGMGIDERHPHALAKELQEDRL